MRDGMCRELLRMWLRRRDRVPLCLGDLRRALRRKVGRERRPPFIHIRLHVRMGLGRGVRVLRARLGHVGRDVGVLLGVVDGRMRHVGEAIHRRTLGRTRRADLLDHIRRHPSHVVPRARSRSDLRLWRVAPLHDLSGVLRKRHTVRDRRRRRGRVMPEMLEGRLPLEVRRDHVCLHGLTVRRRSICLLVRRILGAAVEVGRPFVLIWPTMLFWWVSRGQEERGRDGARRTYVYLVMSSRMSPDEYSYSFLLLPKMKTATSTEQSTESSWAFLNRPPFRFKKVL